VILILRRKWFSHSSTHEIIVGIGIVFVTYFIVQWSSIAGYVCNDIQLSALLMFGFFNFTVIFVVSIDHFYWLLFSTICTS